jgi:hypothetical protein
MWTPAQILAGRHREEERRREYYDALYPPGLWARLWPPTEAALCLFARYFPPDNK